MDRGVSFRRLYGDDSFPSDVFSANEAAASSADKIIGFSNGKRDHVSDLLDRAERVGNNGYVVRIK